MRAVLIRQRQRCIASGLAVWTMEVYSRSTTQFMTHLIAVEGCADAASAGATPATLTPRIVRCIEAAYRKHAFEVGTAVKRHVAALQHVVGIEAFPFEGRLDPREVLTELRDAHPDVCVTQGDASCDFFAAAPPRDLYTAGRPPSTSHNQ
jgi:hypothetical protein